MGNAEEHAGSGTIETSPLESRSVRRLTVSACVLVMTTMCTLFILHYQRRDYDERLIRATQLAQEGLDDFMARRATVGARAFAPTSEEWIVLGGAGQRFVRTVEVSPAGGGRPVERVTVTVGWETLAGMTRVSVHGLFANDDADRGTGPGFAGDGGSEKLLHPEERCEGVPRP
jgi:hypothetical protein